mmetsp:Transcript_78330/g.227252  ORF Transcript_78330/g.227252 Transcript_78330/m.227252 type:complete len:263 (+) Transcript_78330:56-844(+)
MAQDVGAVRTPDLADGASDESALEYFCRAHSACGDRPPRWSAAVDDRGVVAQVDIDLLGVPHKFAGAACASGAAARADTAKRVLWYLQCSGYEECFKVPMMPAMRGDRIHGPPAGAWTDTDSSACDKLAAERRTALMRVQNRLQRELSSVIPLGRSVWNWSYEAAQPSAGRPRCRAVATVPGLGRSFSGPWASGKREAQIEASLVIERYLDSRREAGELSSGSWSTDDSDRQQHFEVEEGQYSSSAEDVERMPRWADIEVDS